MTRTAQESKLFPILPYLVMTFIDAYCVPGPAPQGAPKHVTPEDVGHRIRNSSDPDADRAGR